jgi:hypothetical protein
LLCTSVEMFFEELEHGGCCRPSLLSHDSVSSIFKPQILDVRTGRLHSSVEVVGRVDENDGIFRTVNQQNWRHVFADVRRRRGSTHYSQKFRFRNASLQCASKISVDSRRTLTVIRMQHVSHCAGTNNGLQLTG